VRGSTGRAPVALALATGVVALAGPASAPAATLFAAPGGALTGNCETPNPPCTLQRAVEDEAASGDEVIVQQGSYSEGMNQLVVPVNVNVHGAAGQARPVITSNFSNHAVSATGANARLADLAITYSGAANALRIENDVVAERLYVLSGGTSACGIIDATLRDSVCWSTAVNGNGVHNSSGVSTTVSTILRNVTAIGDGAGSDGIHFAAASNLNHTIDAKNVIASGMALDVAAETLDAGSTTTVNLTNSNYATTDASGLGAQSVTPAGSATNQIAAPGFENAAAGDFHQSPNSVTVDAGAADPQIGSQDLDGEARNQGAAPDIGADELPVAAPPAGDTFPPDTGIRKGPKKKTPKRKAKFKFGGSEPGVTFECRLDEAPWLPCTSPHKIKGLKRKAKYVFAVRAVDVAGNADPTPADRRWKVTKKK
jgi:hypothetical protein